MLDDEFIHSWRDGQKYSHAMNAEVRTKACTTAERFTKCSEKVYIIFLEEHWKWPDRILCWMSSNIQWRMPGFFNRWRSTVLFTTYDPYKVFRRALQKAGHMRENCSGVSARFVQGKTYTANSKVQRGGLSEPSKLDRMWAFNESNESCLKPIEMVAGTGFSIETRKGGYFSYIIRCLLTFSMSQNISSISYEAKTANIHSVPYSRCKMDGVFVQHFCRMLNHKSYQTVFG